MPVTARPVESASPARVLVRESLSTGVVLLVVRGWCRSTVGTVPRRPTRHAGRRSPNRLVTGHRGMTCGLPLGGTRTTGPAPAVRPRQAGRALRRRADHPVAVDCAEAL